MTESVNQLIVERAANGFQVYLNDHRQVGTVRPLPYVFESMENLLEFIKNKFNDATNQ
jgi:hypothetical protein